MFLQLGNIVYELLKSPHSYSMNENVSFAEHALIDTKPVLQRTGVELKQVQMSIRLRQNYCNVKEELNKLVTAKNKYEVLPLLWGNGDIEGDFVITEYSQDAEEIDPVGNLISVVVNLSLKEFVIKDKKKEDQLQAKKNAFAVNKPGESKQPVSVPKQNPDSCCKSLSTLVSKVKNLTLKIDDYVREYIATDQDTLENEYRFKIDAACSNIIEVCNTLRAFTGECISKTPKLKEWASQVSSSANFLKQAVKIAPILKPKIKIDNGTLQTRLRSLVNESAPVVKCAATRN